MSNMSEAIMTDEFAAASREKALSPDLEPTGSLHVMDTTGDTRLQWSQFNVAEVKKAKEKFDEYKAKGYLAYRVNAKGTQGEVIKEFDPTAERIILHSQMQGG